MLLIALFCLIPPAHSYGRVFWKWHTGDSSESLFPVSQLQGKPIYRTSLKINGGAAALTILSCDANVRSISQRLRSAGRSAGSLRFLRAGQDSAFGVAARDGRVLRILAMSAGDPDRSLVFLIEQSEQDLLRSRTPAARQVLSDLPSYPGSTPMTFMRNDDTRTAMETLSIPSSDASGIRDFYHQTLARDGWHPALPATAASPDSGATLFVRDTDICCVMIQPQETSGETLVTLLHKPLTTH